MQENLIKSTRFAEFQQEKPLDYGDREGEVLAKTFQDLPRMETSKLFPICRRPVFLRSPPSSCPQKSLGRPIGRDPIAVFHRKSALLRSFPKAAGNLPRMLYPWQYN